MGYTHYWKMVEKFDPKQFEKVVSDFKKVVEHLSPFVPLAGGLGQGKAVIDNNMIWFNGTENCGHTERNLVSYK